MSINFTSKELFGGAIVLDFPDGWLDASTIRQIPDHQEVFLSPTSLTNVVIEINERVTPETTGSTASSSATSSGSSGAREKIDKAAILYHLHDLVETNPERSLPQATTESNQTTIRLQPTPVTLSKFGGSTPAYILSGVSTDTSTDNANPTKSTRKETMIFLLMVRLEQQETDLLIILSSPFIGEEGTREIGQEGEGWARDVLERMAASLEIKDWGLFGGDGS